MKIWTISNQKGGVGKTTTAVSLGGLLAEQGQRVLLLDLDPQGSLTSYFRCNPDDMEHSVYSLFAARANDNDIRLPETMLKDTGVAGLSLIPASAAMATLDRQLGACAGMGLVVSQALVRLQAQFDYVLMDCPPMLGVLMVNALAACERLLIPVQTEFLALKSLERMLHTLQMIGRSRGSRPPYTVMPTFFDRRTRASLDALRVMRDLHGDHLWTRVIPIDTLFREASRSGVPISVYDAQARGTEAYRSLLRWLDSARAAASESCPARVSTR